MPWGSRTLQFVLVQIIGFKPFQALAACTRRSFGPTVPLAYVQSLKTNPMFFHKDLF